MNRFFTPCEYKFCSQIANFHFPQGRASLCKEHQLRGMKELEIPTEKPVHDKNKANQIRNLQKKILYLKNRAPTSVQPCVCKRERDENGQLVPYEDLQDRQEMLRALKKYVVLGSTDAEKTWKSFLADAMGEGREHNINARLETVLDSSPVSKAFNRKVKTLKQEKVKSAAYDAETFVSRKLNSLGRQTFNEMTESRQNSARISLTKKNYLFSPRKR